MAFISLVGSVCDDEVSLNVELGKRYTFGPFSKKTVELIQRVIMVAVVFTSIAYYSQMVLVGLVMGAAIEKLGAAVKTPPQYLDKINQSGWPTVAGLTLAAYIFTPYAVFAGALVVGADLYRRAPALNVSLS